MVPLNEGEAFAALEALLSSGGEGTEWCSSVQAWDRLRIALSESPNQASHVDLAVLLRQALQYEFARREFVVSPAIMVRHDRFRGFSAWDSFGLRSRMEAAGVLVSAVPWRPSWIDVDDPQGIDAYASSERRIRFFDGQDVPGDPLLESVNRKHYRSTGQRAAARTALMTPPGGTTVIALPTGEGKSLIFQLVHAVGFTGASSEARGVTLVIVPTVALGVNHQLEAVSVCGLAPPLAYQGGNDAQNSQIVQKTADGSQGLCFASPEAACAGPLREALRKAAEGGYLRALVIDEAHLVDQWGTGFRTEFQELSGLRRELVAASPPASRLRTILLSATLTESSLETLSSFFGGEENFVSFSAVQLRPEPDYWIASECTEEERNERILEALHHVPRPAVLYVTEVAEADSWMDRIVASGFRRIAKLHGRTGRSEREAVVENWRAGRLDIVVGTSAFGLGIDYQHARTVLHACVPETLDRFYQEVGRAGRDGRASLSLIIPTRKDRKSAKRLNREKIISVDRGLGRWTAMFEAKLRLPSGRFAVDTSGRPGHGVDDLDMKGELNTEWNLRTLALMARAKVIKMLGAPYPKLEQAGDWVELDILDEGHLERAVWIEKIEPIRAASALARGHNLSLMVRYLADRACPASVFETLYGSDRIGTECSRCSICRADPTDRRSPKRVGEPKSEWPALPISNDLTQILGRDGRLLVTYEAAEIDRRTSRHLGECFVRLNYMGISKLIRIGETPFNMEKVLAFAKRKPFFVSDLSALVYSRLPRGPEIVMVGAGARLEAANLIPKSDTPRIFIVPADRRSSDGRRLSDVFGGRVLELQEFIARVSQ